RSLGDQLLGQLVAEFLAAHASNGIEVISARSDRFIAASDRFAAVRDDDPTRRLRCTEFTAPKIDPVAQALRALRHCRRDVHPLALPHDSEIDLLAGLIRRENAGCVR